LPLFKGDELMAALAFYMLDANLAPHIVDPIAPFLAERGYRILVLHAASVSNSPLAGSLVHGKPYRAIDIASEGLTRTLKAAKQEAVCCLVMLGFRSLLDLLVLRAARVLGIPTLYMEHGLFIAGSAEKFRMSSKTKSLSRYARLAGMYFLFLIGRLRFLVGDIVLLARAMLRNDYSCVRHDHALFYAEHGYTKLKPLFYFTQDEVSFAGYPLVATDRELQEIQQQARISEARMVLFVHQAFAADGLCSLDIEHETAFYRALSAAVERNNYHAVIKIHPRAPFDDYKQALQGSMTVVGAGESLGHLVAQSSIVVGQCSTALFMPVVLRRPLIIIDLPGVQDIYLRVFEQVGIRARTVQEFEQILSDHRMLHSRLSSYGAFQKYYIGADNTFQQQADTIVKIANRVHGTARASETAHRGSNC
jgi:hypothetical protein